MTLSTDKDAGAETFTQNEPSRRNRRILLGLILLGYAVVTLIYGTLNPLFEAPDEVWHFFTAQYIAENGALPFVAPGVDYDEWLGQEAAQPPLYYLIGGLLTSPIDTGTARDEVKSNKFAAIGDASTLINVNRFIHMEGESWPWSGYALAAHILRWFSTFLGLGTLLCIYLTGRLLWPDDSFPALLATSLAAFLPQFNFLHASVSNDPLIIFLVSATLWQLARLWQTEVTRARLLLLGLTVGGALLAKNAGMILLAYSIVVILLLALRSESDVSLPQSDGRQVEMGGWRMVGETLLLVALPAILVGGWLWIRNWLLYGDITAANQFIRIAGGDRDYTLFQVLRETRGLWLSTFAVFGWFNLRAPNWVYWFWSALAGLAVIGASWRAMVNYPGRGLEAGDEDDGNERSFQDRLGAILHQDWFLPFLLFLWVAAVYSSLLLFMLRTEAAQGRLLFPALVPLALGMASGLTATARLCRISVVFPPAAILITLYCLFYVIQPAYEKPPVVASLPPEAVELNMDMGHGVKLVGAELELETAMPGDAVWLTLFWRADRVTEEMPEFVLSIFGRDNDEIGKVHSYHGRGLYPAGMWPEGQIIADRFGLQIDEEAATPVLARIDTTILEGATSPIGEIKIQPQSWPPITEEILAQFGPQIGLVDVRVESERAHPGDVVSVATKWQTRGEPEADFTTLLHLGQPDAGPLATGDRPPLNGSYPTRAWERGETFEDSYELVLPDDLAAGRYPIWLGMYDPKTMTRLPIIIEEEAQPFDVYLAGWIDVE